MLYVPNRYWEAAPDVLTCVPAGPCIAYFPCVYPQKYFDSKKAHLVGVAADQNGGQQSGRGPASC